MRRHKGTLASRAARNIVDAAIANRRVRNGDGW
jgi:hypothetical protein